MSDLTHDELIRELNSTRCPCGKRKIPSMTFCQKCYYKLPKPLRNALYLNLSDMHEKCPCP